MVASMLSVGLEVPDTEAEGPGRRYAIWLQGCPMRCPGCCNPELLSFREDRAVDVETLAARILATDAEGITLLGGEPFSQAAAAAELAALVRPRSVVVFSGFTLEEIEAQGADAAALLANTDLLIDGRYDRGQPDEVRRWIGSTNQRAHFLTDRYDESIFEGRDTIELRYVDGLLTINGRPWSGAMP